MFKWNKDKCLRCGGCVGVCPQEALELTEAGIINDDSKCVECGTCAKFCPVGAITIEKKKK